MVQNPFSKTFTEWVGPRLPSPERLSVTSGQALNLKKPINSLPEISLELTAYSGKSFLRGEKKCTCDMPRSPVSVDQPPLPIYQNCIPRSPEGVGVKLELVIRTITHSFNKAFDHLSVQAGCAVNEEIDNANKRTYICSPCYGNAQKYFRQP